MTQRTNGLRSILSLAAMYRSFQRAVGSEKCSKVFVKEYMRAAPCNQVLDIGCGPGDICDHLESVCYTGFDVSPNYVAHAKKRFGKVAHFYCSDVIEHPLFDEPAFDIVLAQRVLHHLSDIEAVRLFKLARSALKPRGRLITLDGCYVEGQSSLDRFLLDRDRGMHVRTEEGYTRVAGSVFGNVVVSIRDDLLRIPYTHLIMECS